MVSINNNTEQTNKRTRMDIVDRTIRALGNSNNDGYIMGAPPAVWPTSLTKVFILAKFMPNEQEYEEIIDILRNGAADGCGPAMALQYCNHLMGNGYDYHELLLYFSDGAAPTMSAIVPDNYICVTIQPFTLAYPQYQNDWQTEPMFFMQSLATV